MLCTILLKRTNLKNKINVIYSTKIMTINYELVNYSQHLNNVLALNHSSHYNIEIIIKTKVISICIHK